MYAWIWRRLPGAWHTKLAVAGAAVLAVAAVLWNVVFPWVEPKVQFDHGVVTGTPSPSSGSSSEPPGPGIP
ncbi:hypothetical protein [Actinomadura sp. WMMB 499]|uniref:hypothetical protein n=1 Tax=Actinomadura sp. WMMB 499 TaxID=1219491 RepID=UPI0012457283|nr:hypothetical protein [Actinomadura sp. WMMB 499]QFG23111.1 hypothetical protein F7P10_20275 [Actinomadura sp. WMMB 499]